MKTLTLSLFCALLLPCVAFGQVDKLIDEAQLSVIKISADRIIEAQASDYEKFFNSDAKFMDKVGAWWLNWKIDSKAKSISSYVEKMREKSITKERLEALNTDHKQLVEMRERFVDEYSKSFLKTVY